MEAAFRRVPFCKGDTWYLVNQVWFDQFRRFLESGRASRLKPGPIDNKSLFKIDGSLRDEMTEGWDYSIVTSEVWTDLLSNFGLSEGQKPIKRDVVEYQHYCTLEVYLREFVWAEKSNLEETKKKKISRGDTVETVITNMKKEYNIAPAAETKLFVKQPFANRNFEELKLDTIVANILGRMLVMEVKNEDGTWPNDVGYHRRSPESYASAAAYIGSLKTSKYSKYSSCEKAIKDISIQVETKKIEKIKIMKDLQSLEQKKREIEKQMMLEKEELMSQQKKLSVEISSLQKSSQEYEDIASKLNLDDANKKLVAFLRKTIKEKEEALLCPVCLLLAAPPIFSCQKMHLVCSSCKPKLNSCPECREEYHGELRRHRYAEKDVDELKKLREELNKITS